MNSCLNKVCKDKAELERLEKSLESNDFLLDKLSQVCYNITRELKKVTITDYNSSGWAYEQAHRNGGVEALDKLLSILTKRT